MRVEIPGQGVFDLGTTETAPTIGIVDYSRRVTDDFGVTTVVERGFARRMSVRLAVAFDEVDALQRRLAALRATPVLWVADDDFDSLTMQGFYKDFSLDLALPPVSYCTLTIEGLAETGAFADPGGDPAADGATSTLRLLQPIAVTDALLTSSNVAETDYPEWAAGSTYALGARVIKAAVHRVYESVTAANVGNDPAASANWIDIGPTNRWAMFDQALGTATTAPGTITVTIDPGETVDGVALLDVEAATVRVEAAGYDRTQAVASQPGMVTFLDIPPTDGTVTVTITGIGDVSVGTMLIGRVVGLGTTEASPTAAITDYSRKETDDFGEVTVVERAWAKRMTVNALLRTDAVDLVAGRIAAVRARPSLWIGGEGLESVTIYGFFKDFSIEVGENVSRLSLSVEGLSKAAKIAPLVVEPGEVSWSDIVDDDPAHPKPEDGATVGATPEQATEIAKVGSLEADTAQAAIDIANAEALIEDIQGSVTADLTAINASLDALETEADGLQSAMTSVQGTIGDIEASVAGITGEVATLTTGLSTANANIGINASAISGLEGSVATLSATAASQGAAIGVNAAAISTAQGDLATLTTELRAGSNPNLLINGGFEDGLANWTPAGQYYAAWTYGTGYWGNFGYQHSDWTGSPSEPFSYLESQRYPIVPGHYHTVSADSDMYMAPGHTGAQAWLSIVWLDASQNYLSSSTRPDARPAPHSFTFDGSGREALKVTALAPAGAAYAFVQLIGWAPNGCTVASLGFRQVKFEAGAVATPYTAEASAIQSFTALRTLDMSYAALSTTVSSVSGSVSTLQSSMTDAQGSISTLQADVSSLYGSVSFNASSISTLSGTVSSLGITVAAQGSSITSLGAAQSTAAGQIATLQTQINAGGGNLLGNTDFALDYSGWDSGGSMLTGVTFGKNHPGIEWTPAGENVLGVAQVNATTTGYQEYAQNFNIVANSWYDISCYVAAHRCLVEIIIQWLDSNGTAISADANGAIAGGLGGTNLWNFDRYAFKRQAPSTAARARLYMRKYSTLSGSSPASSYAWFCRPQVAETTSTSASPLAYSVGSARATISTQASAISTASGQIASLSSTVSTQGASISSQASAITTLQGTTASLQTQINSANASISTNATAVSTIQGDVATLTTRVTASAPNLVRYGGFPDGLTGWTTSGSGWLAGGADDPNWGRFVVVNAAGDSYASTAIQAVQPNQQYTISADIDRGGSSGGYVAARIVWTQGGSTLSVGPAALKSSGGFSNDEAGRVWATGTAPSSADGFYVQLVVEGGITGNQYWRRIKVNTGSYPARYSEEAGIVQSFQALSTLTTQYASLSSTVSTQGVTVSTHAAAITSLDGQVATLFGKYGWEIDVNGYVTGFVQNNNGSRSDATFRVDKFTLVAPGGGARSEFRGGTLFGYDDAGTKRYQLGNMALT